MGTGLTTLGYVRGRNFAFYQPDVRFFLRFVASPIIYEVVAISSVQQLFRYWGHIPGLPIVVVRGASNRIC